MKDEVGETIKNFTYKKEKYVELLCLDCGNMWLSDAGKICVMCESKNNIEI